MSATLPPVLERGLFVNGVAQPVEGAALTITNPGTGELVGRATAADAAGVEAAVRVAHEAFPAWARLGYSDRGKILHACAQAFDAHVDELVPMLVAEEGKTIREAKLELRKAAETLEHYAGMQKEVRGVYVHGLDTGVDGRVLRKPLGVVVAIVPWNFPTTLLCNKLGPALLCGNTVVAKPADTTPFTTLRLAEILTQAGLPPGVLNVVTGTGPGAGEALVTHPLVRKVAFTGSTPTGEHIAALAAQGSKRVTLELGGSDPMIICDDADLAAAASAASMGRFYNCGQACLATKRVYVFEAVADQVIEAITAKVGELRVGIGSEPASQIGPVHSARQLEILERQVSESMAGGGELLIGGRRPDDPALADGHFYEPTVVLEPLRTHRWRARRSSVRSCPSGASTTSTRPCSSPMTRPSAWGHRYGRAISSAPSVRRPSSSAATPGSTRPSRSTTSCRLVASRPAATARSTGRRRSTFTPTRSRSS